MVFTLGSCRSDGLTTWSPRRALGIPAFAEAPAASKMERLNDMVLAFTDAQRSQIKTAAFQDLHDNYFFCQAV